MKTERLYRPSNGSEGEYFMSIFYDSCKRDACLRDGTGSGCQIAMKTMAYDIGDADYPREWIYDGENPTCTAFDRGAGFSLENRK